MASRGNVRVSITADTEGLKRGTQDAEKHLGRLRSRASESFGGVRTSILGASAALVGGAGLIEGLKSTVEAANRAEVSQKKLETQLKANGVTYKAHAKEIEEVIHRTSALAGITEHDLQDSFTNIVRVTGKVQPALKLVGLAADFARAKHMDVAKAGELLGKVAGGNVGILSRYGLAVKPVTTAVDALRESHKKATIEQTRAAQAADKAATAQAGIASLQKRFGGQAEAYGKTTQGSMDRARVAVEHLQEELGAKLAPAVGAAADALAKFINQAGSLQHVQTQLQRQLGVSAKDFDRLKQDITTAFHAIVPVVSSALTGMVQQFRGAARIIGGVVKVITGLLHGDFRQAWVGVKQIFSGGIQTVIGILRADTAPIRAAGRALGNALEGGFKSALNLAHELAVEMRDLISKAPGFALGVGKAIVRGIIDGIQAAAGGIAGAVTGAVKGAIPHLPKLPFGIGDGPGAGTAPGKGSAALLGARSSLSPFARIGAGFGLHVSSGLRPGAITSSGNVSYHSSGEAIDEAGSPAGMMGFFQAMKSRFGSSLAELIYGPGKIGIKNGQPFNFGPALNAQHMDHVHVALDTGKPGVGDGYGKSQLVSLWERAGGPASAANIAAAVALAESGGQSTATHRNSDGSIDRGLWQINSVHGAQSTLVPLANARAAVSISSGGRNWNPWTTFTSGAYKRFLGKNAGPKQTAAQKRAASKRPRINPKDAAKAHAIHSSIAGPPSQAAQDAATAERIAEQDHAAAVAASAGQPVDDTGGDTGGGVDDNTAAIDALTEQVRITNQKLELQTTLAQQALQKYNVSQSDYGTLQKALANIVSGEIGGRTGLGFMTPSFAGGGSRY